MTLDDKYMVEDIKENITDTARGYVNSYVRSIEDLSDLKNIVTNPIKEMFASEVIRILSSPEYKFISLVDDLSTLVEFYFSGMFSRENLFFETAAVC